VFVSRLVGGAQTPVRRHGELGAERLRGAEDPIGRRGVVVILSDGGDHGGGPRNLPPGTEIIDYFYLEVPLFTLGNIALVWLRLCTVLFCFVSSFNIII